MDASIIHELVINYFGNSARSMLDKIKQGAETQMLINVKNTNNPEYDVSHFETIEKNIIVVTKFSTPVWLISFILFTVLHVRSAILYQKRNNSGRQHRRRTGGGGEEILQQANLHSPMVDRCRTPSGHHFSSIIVLTDFIWLIFHSVCLSVSSLSKFLHGMFPYLSTYVLLFTQNLVSTAN